MSDKVIDEALGISGPFKMPAQDLVDSGQCPTEKPKLEIANQQDWGDLKRNGCSGRNSGTRKRIRPPQSI